MIPHPTMHWHEILAAYADGEFEGRDDLALLKQRVEEWLSRHPEAHAELAQYRRLKQAWQETTPAAPPAEHWRRVLEAIHAAGPDGDAPARSARPWRRIAVGVAAAACIAVVALLPGRRPPTVQPAPDSAVADEVLSVATMDEVEILLVEGTDTHTVIVGALPLVGSLELAAHGDVTVTSMQPDAHDRMVPSFPVENGRRPMIWARLDTE